MELIGSDDAPVVARTGSPGDIHVEAAQGTLYTVPSLANLRVTASLKSLMVPDVFGLALSACDATIVTTEDVLQGRAASLGITVDGLRLATRRGVGAERALLNGGVVQRARVSVDAVSIEMDGDGGCRRRLVRTRQRQALYGKRRDRPTRRGPSPSRRASRPRPAARSRPRGWRPRSRSSTAPWRRVAQ